MNIRTKADALALFGGRQGVAKALGIRPHAVSQWPDALGSRLIDELVGAAWRLGLMWRRPEANDAGEFCPDPAALVESHAELLEFAKRQHGVCGLRDEDVAMIARAEAARGN